MNNSIISAVDGITTPAPVIVSAKSLNCGRSIQVKWKWIGHKMQIYLASSVDRSAQKFFLIIPQALPSRTFDDLTSNTDYEVRLRAINYRNYNRYYHWYPRRPKYVYGDWTKKQVKTIAGQYSWYDNIVIYYIYQLVRTL